MSGMLRWFGLLLLAATGVLLTGCSNGEAPSTLPQTSLAPIPTGTPTAAAATTTTYVGTVGGADARVAVVVDGTRALAYVCDGVPGDGAAATAPAVQAWFNVASDGSTVDASQPPLRLQLQLTGTTMTGTLTLPDGRAAPVTGAAVTGDAGLYRAAGDAAVAGWIYLAQDDQRGGVGLEGGGRLAAPRLTLAQPTINIQSLANARIAKVGITPIPIP